MTQSSQRIKYPPAYGQRSAEDGTRPLPEAKRAQTRAVETPAADETAAAKLDRALAAVDRLERENAELRARLAPDPDDVFVPLKAAIPAGFSYETIRSWVHAGFIASRREGGRISVGVRSLNERLARMNRRS
ncbi:MAG: hypothetical protein ACLPTZ_07185 [Beijerinckiaceae bacterium]